MFGCYDKNRLLEQEWWMSKTINKIIPKPVEDNETKFHHLLSRQLSKISMKNSRPNVLEIRPNIH